MKKCNTFAKEIYIFIPIVVLFVIPPILCGRAPNLIEQPSKISEWINFIILLILLAGYEEAMYRFYLPTRLNLFLRKTRVAESFITEIIPIVLFGLAHRYSGLSGVLYATIMGSILQAIFYHTRNKLLGFVSITIIHATHNFIVYAHLFNQS